MYTPSVLTSVVPLYHLTVGSPAAVLPVSPSQVKSAVSPILPYCDTGRILNAERVRISWQLVCCFKREDGIGLIGHYELSSVYKSDDEKERFSKLTEYIHIYSISLHYYLLRLSEVVVAVVGDLISSIYIGQSDVAS